MAKAKEVAKSTAPPHQRHDPDDKELQKDLKEQQKEMAKHAVKEGGDADGE
jgi:hypothetical protein|tara:strand:- start:536 stop:688 length:153 start_codon:yes stop_codon:yes gene_type:complete